LGRTINDPGRAANIAGARFTPMTLVKWGFIGLLLLPLAEAAVFIIVALAIGWFWAICLFLATTLVGLAILKQSGRKDVDRFRAEFAKEGIYAIHLESPGLGPILGGILLVIPGFITDALGLMLFVPGIRRWLRATLGRALEKARRARDPAVVDLAPDEWRRLSDKAIDYDTKRKQVR
jgi:UPF0716 protein FxsA